MQSSESLLDPVYNSIHREVVGPPAITTLDSMRAILLESLGAASVGVLVQRTAERIGMSRRNSTAIGLGAGVCWFTARTLGLAYKEMDSIFKKAQSAE